MLCLKFDSSRIVSNASDFVHSQGRMKYVRPIFRALSKIDKSKAKSIFNSARRFYHPITAKMVEKDLE